MSEAIAKTSSKKQRKVLLGVVTSDKMDKTRVVQVRWRTFHSKYKKVVYKANKFKAHDEKNESKTGDRVRMMETRPLSKDKRWVIKEIIEKVSEVGQQ